MLNNQEFIHLIKHICAQQMQDIRTTRVGHIASYDPKTNMVRCILPDVTDFNGQPVTSPWMPLGSGMVGPGYGMQYIPKGGATPDNPAGGEMCIVQIIERDSGFAFAANLLFSSTQPPPMQDGKPGEWIVTQDNGSLLRMYANGDITIGATKSLFLAAAENVVISAGSNLLMTAENTASLNAKYISTKSEKTTQMESGEKMNFLSQDTMSLASNKNMNLTAYENMGLKAAETMVVTGKNVTNFAEEDITIAAGKKLVNVSNEGSSYSSNMTININSEKQIVIDGGPKAFFTADAINIYTRQGQNNVFDVKTATRKRPKGWDQIGKWKAGSGSSEPDGGGAGNIKPAESNGKSFGNETGTGTHTYTRTHGSSGKLYIDGKLQELTNAADSFSGDQQTDMVNWDGVPVYGYDATLDQQRYGGGLAGPSSAEQIAGPGSIARGNSSTFQFAKPGELLIDGTDRAKIDAKKTEVLAQKTVKIDSKDDLLMSARRLMGISAPSLKIRAVNDANSDLTLIGSRINMTTDLGFEDGTSKQIKISTTTGGDIKVTSGKDYELNVINDIAVNAQGNISSNSTGETIISSFDAMTVTSLAHQINIGSGAAGDIVLWNTGNTYLNSAGVFAFSGVSDPTYRRLLDDRFLTSYNAHTHGGVTSGPDTTNPPPTVNANSVCTDILKGA